MVHTILFSQNGNPGLLNSFSATLSGFSNVVSVCMCSLPECQSSSAEQQSRGWPGSFLFQKRQISPDNILLIVFPPAPKPQSVQPIRWQHGPAASAAPRHCAHIWIARQNYKPRPHTALARPLVCTATPHGCHVSSLLLAHVPSDCSGEPCVVPVSCVTTAELSSPGSSMSATKQGLVQEWLVSLTVKLAGFSIFLIWHWSWWCLWSWALCFLISLCGIVGVEQMWVYLGMSLSPECRWDRLPDSLWCWEKR